MSAIAGVNQATRRELNGLRQHYQQQQQQQQQHRPSPSAAVFSDPHGRVKARLGREIERELGLFSFSTADENGSPRRNNVPEDYTHDYSQDYKDPADTGRDSDFLPRSPNQSTSEINRHFHDFSMHGIETSYESVEMPRGGGKVRGTPEVHPNTLLLLTISST
jgi:hypothetical protein